MENVSDKEIVGDINKIKGIRTKIKLNANDNLEFLMDEYMYYTEKLQIMKFSSVIVTILSLVFGNISFSSIVALIYLGRFYINNKKIDDIITCYYYENLYKNKFLSLTENFIDDHQALLDYRKDKKLNEGIIKNLNVCFGFEKDYKYELNKINNKYKVKSINIEDDKYNDLSVIKMEYFYDELEYLYEIKAEDKIKKKLLLHDDFSNR